ncbi:MAG: redoxin domain-containing protein [Fimbriimonadaceae bacterium]|nr:redoxin domain-containing protein [Fimbriimonadaceae bacterium]
MTLPETTVVFSSGDRTTFEDLIASGPLALIFLRHLNCPFCADQVERLRDHADLHAIFVGMVDRLDADAFMRKLRSQHRMICDPEAKLYNAFGLSRGTIGQLIGPRVVVKGVAQMAKGRFPNVPKGDARQMPGVFVINQRGVVVLEHRCRDAADNVDASVIREALSRAVVQDSGGPDDQGGHQSDRGVGIGVDGV